MEKFKVFSWVNQKRKKSFNSCRDEQLTQWRSCQREIYSTGDGRSKPQKDTIKFAKALN